MRFASERMPDHYDTIRALFDRKGAYTYMMRAVEWVQRHRDRLSSTVDPILAEAFEVVSWDVYLIRVKLRRALDGRDRCRREEEEGDDHPVQNDWNGSAKVALISIERSEAAWQVIADATRDDNATRIAQMAAELRSGALAEFPHAMSFVRPGFDERCQ
jgi:hypothetical protein